MRAALIGCIYYAFRGNGDGVIQEKADRPDALSDMQI
jgi:hypothetical protein